MAGDGDFRSVMHSIMDGLTAENIQMIQYLCKDAIPGGREIKTAIGFLEHFEAKGWIHPDDLSFLAEVLYRINRHDLLKKLPGVKNRRDYEENFLKSGQLNFSPFRIACFQLLDDLTSSEFEIMKNLCKDELSVRNYNRSTNVLQLLVCLEEEDLICADDLEFMLKILKMLDNQKPYKTFLSLRDGDISYTRPKKQLSYPLFPSTSSTSYDRQPVHYSPSLPQFPSPGYRKFDQASLPPRWSANPQRLVHNPGAWTGDADLNMRTFVNNDTSLKSSNTSYPQPYSYEDGIPQASAHNVEQMTGHETVLKHVASNQHMHSSASNFCSIVPSAVVSFASPVHVQQEDSNLAESLSHMQVTHQEHHTMERVPQEHESDNPRIINDTPHLVNDGASNMYECGALYDAAKGTNNSLCFDSPPTGNFLEKYCINSNPCGICLIINNERFEQEKHLKVVEDRLQIPGNDFQAPNISFTDRSGSSEDVRKVKNLFTEFGFDVRIHENLDHRAMCKVLIDCASEDHSKYDCFVCVVMSHGLEGSVYGVDGMPVSIVRVHKEFRPEKCPTLVNKPKLFFFQACQGDQKMGGHSAVIANQRVGQSSPMADVEADSPLMLPPLCTPSEADFLISHSTVPGFLSYRDRNNGSWFISTLVENLKKYHQNEDILSILIKVNLEMASKPYKQMPMPVATLRKKVFFTKKDSLLGQQATVAENINVASTVLTSECALENA